MVDCHVCGETLAFPRSCNECGKAVCSQHTLPENHDCEALRAEGRPRFGTGDDASSGTERERPEPMAFSDDQVLGTPPDETLDRGPDVNPDGTLKTASDGSSQTASHGASRTRRLVSWLRSLLP